MPGGQTLFPSLNAQTQTVGSYQVYSDASVSPRGTAMINLEIRHSSGNELSGDWKYRLVPTRDFELLAYSWDDVSGWAGFTTWTGANSTHTVVQPGTADESIAVAAYSPRDCSRCSPPGRLNSFSGRGKRLDGVSMVDITAPGSRVFSTGPKEETLGLGNISTFGGTSSALPHVVGAAALLLQLNPNDSHSVIERILRETALEDSDTGPLPDDNWGAGKLRIRPAYEVALKPSLLRSDAVTSLGPTTPSLDTVFIGGAGDVTLTMTGPADFSVEGEGGPLDQPGSSDGDQFLIGHIDPGSADPEGLNVLTDASRPLVFYQMTGPGLLRLTRTPEGVTVWF